MNRIREILARDRLYVWLLIFIVSINIALFLSKEDPSANNVQEEVLEEERPVREILKEKALSRGEIAKLLEKNAFLRISSLSLSFFIFFAIIFGLLMDFIILGLKKEGRPLIAPSCSHKEPKWGLRDIVKIVILFLWFGYIIAICEGGFSKVFPVFENNENMISVLNAAAMDLLIFIFIIYFVVNKYKEKIAALGMTMKNFSKNVLYGLAGYFAIVPILVVVLLCILLFSAVFKYEPPAQPVLKIFLEEKQGFLMIFLTLLVAIFGPITEEVFFRAFMYKAVKTRWGVKTAFYSTSVLFALLHANIVGFFPILVLGMLLTYLFERTGTIVASCTEHIVHNSAMLSLAYLLKGFMR